MDANVFQSAMQGLAKIIKSEPADNYPQLVPATDEDFSTLQNPPIPLGHPSTQQPIRVKNIFHESNFAGANNRSTVRASSRDPRLKNVEFNPVVQSAPVVDPIVTARKKAFLNGEITMEQFLLTNGSVGEKPKVIRDIRKWCGDAYQLLESPTAAIFYANIPTGELVPNEQDKTRPFLAGTHSAMFLSQATSENISETIESQRFRNIPRNIRSLCHRLGVDVGSISQLVSRAKDDDVVMVEKKDCRNMYVQTDPVEFVDEKPPVELVEKEVQTTKNDGFFTFTCELKNLTSEQREWLQQFKKAMNIQDELSVKSVLERLKHRNVMKAFAENKNYDQKYDHAEPSNIFHAGKTKNREQQIDSYSNPPPPGL